MYVCTVCSNELSCVRHALWCTEAVVCIHVRTDKVRQVHGEGGETQVLLSCLLTQHLWPHEGGRCGVDYTPHWLHTHTAALCLPGYAVQLCGLVCA